ncbi:MAG: hypothetical protein C4519_21520 [Desulfobacteraceae bacterium]|nr:MAG: hypothetical protein C4519_21520 [Desulfobacteraceae bacterium]
METHLITIGGVNCSLRIASGLIGEVMDLVLADYRRWGFASSGDARISLEIGERAEQAPKEQPGIFCHRLHYESVTATLVLDTSSFAGTIGLELRREDRQTPVRIAELIETFLCNAYLFYFLLHDLGTFLHASAVAEKGKGYIFAGQRQTGKSTAAKLSQPRTILCDELVLLRKDGEGGPRVYGTPWLGDSAPVNRSALCCGVHFLVQSQENRLTPMTTMNAVSELLREGVIGSFLSVPAVQKIAPYAKLFFLLIDLLQNISCRRLHFKKDNSFWSAIYEHEQQALQKPECRLARA